MSSLDPSTKLYRETPCEHGELIPHPTLIHDVDDCPGGSREEVTIDYEAAEAIMLNLRPWDAGAEDWAHEIVDAAFKSAGFTKTFTSEKEH